MPHLDSAYNLARWLVRNDADAQDVVQEASLRAFRHLDGFRGDNPTAWLLAIVRNAAFTWLRANRHERPAGDLEAFEATAERSAGEPPSAATGAIGDPETLLASRRQADTINALVAALPPEYREIIVLREFEDFSYEEIASVVGIPIGTVMSRLSRARRRLQVGWRRRVGEG